MRNEFTLRLLKEAGIAPGMDVLDVGCGHGEVTQLIREMVGDTGSVTGIDMNEQLLSMAEANNHYDNVSYHQMDVYQLDALGQYDAIVGRRILMYVPDAVKALNELTHHLKTDGIIAFQESDVLASGTGADSLPLHQLALKRILKTIEREGGNINIGQQLYSKFIEAGYDHPNVMSEVIIQSSSSGSDLFWLTQMMHERMLEQHVIDEELDLDLLEQEMTQELKNTQTAFVRDIVFGVWSIKKGKDILETDGDPEKGVSLKRTKQMLEEAGFTEKK